MSLKIRRTEVFERLSSRGIPRADLCLYRNSGVVCREQILKTQERLLNITVDLFSGSNIDGIYRYDRRQFT